MVRLLRPVSIAIALPYSKNPTTDPAFETFFSKQWLDNYIVSLHNFLNTIFQNMREYLSLSPSSLFYDLL
jgi:hypothetical protein